MGFKYHNRKLLSSLQVIPYMDFSKLFCHFHSQDLITNYCNKQECQVGLCANCICIHTKMHMQKGSSPNYENIRSTYKVLYEEINSVLNELHNGQCRIEIVESKIVEKRQKLKEIISLARSETIAAVNKFYEFREQQLLREIESEQKKNGLHCKFRLSNLKSSIIKQASTLASTIQNLSNYNFLESLPKIKMQTLHNSRALTSQYLKQVRENQIFNTSITYSKNYFNEIRQVLNKIITLNIGRDPTIGQNTFFNGSNSHNFLKSSSNKNQAITLEETKLFTLRMPVSEKQEKINQDHKQKPGIKNNYNFTFGSQFKQISRPVLRQSLVNEEGNYSGISEKVKGNPEGKLYSPCFVSNFQQKQINNNIKKMQKKSQKFSKYLENSQDKDKEFSQHSSQSFKQFMYRTQLL